MTETGLVSEHQQRFVTAFGYGLVTEDMMTKVPVEVIMCDYSNCTGVFSRP